MVLSPKYGRKNIIFEVFIVASFASMAIIFCKGIGVAFKTSVEGTENPFNRVSFWICIFLLIVIVGIQVVYIQKALDKFNATILMSSIYVVAVSLVIINTSVIFAETRNIGWKDTVLTISGFLINIASLYILNLDLNPTLKTTKDDDNDEVSLQTTQLKVDKNNQEVVRQTCEIRRRSISDVFSTPPSLTPMPTPIKVPSVSNLPNIATSIFKETAESTSCLSLISETPSSKMNYSKDNNSYDSTDTNSQSSSGGSDRCNLHCRTSGNDNGLSTNSSRSSLGNRNMDEIDLAPSDVGGNEPTVTEGESFASETVKYKPSNSASVPDARVTAHHEIDMRNAFSEGNGMNTDSSDDSSGRAIGE